jgi:fibro-slime domain-containing protein
MRLLGLLLLTVAAFMSACRDGSDENDTENGAGDGDADGDADSEPGQQLGTDDCASQLTAIVRDFPNDKSVAPDFYISGSDVATLGMVKDTLDSDNKPQVGSVDMNSSHLAQWYRTKDGVNIEFTEQINLEKNESGNYYYYDNVEFFPLDINEGFGNDIPEYPERNWLFTTELKFNFVYESEQNFLFRGDDDLWVFIEGRLALDVGGIHSPVESSFNLDQFNSENEMGMVPGKTYEMRIFHAERNPTQSNFHIETTIGCFADAPIV